MISFFNRHSAVAHSPAAPLACRQAAGERGCGQHGGQPPRLAPAALHRARPRPVHQRWVLVPGPLWFGISKQSAGVRRATARCFRPCRHRVSRRSSPSFPFLVSALHLSNHRKPTCRRRHRHCPAVRRPPALQAPSCLRRLCIRRRATVSREQRRAYCGGRPAARSQQSHCPSACLSTLFTFHRLFFAICQSAKQKQQQTISADPPTLRPTRVCVHALVVLRRHPVCGLPEEPGHPAWHQGGHRPAGKRCATYWNRSVCRIVLDCVGGRWWVGMEVDTGLQASVAQHVTSSGRVN